MHELKEKTKKISEMEEHFTNALKMRMYDLENLDTKEAGEVVDIIKDLAEAKAYCWKAKYYEEMIESMREGEQSPHYGESRMGYDNWRYSSGRFAPKGKGHISGFDYYPPDTWTRPIMGYDSRNNSGGMGMKRGSHYDEFKDARRYYTETHSEEDKRRMEEHGDKHVKESIETIKDIWQDASPEHKHKMKTELTELVKQMTV